MKNILIILVGISLIGCRTITKNSSPINEGLTPSVEQTALVLQIENDFGGDLTRAEQKSIYIAERKALEFGRNGQALKWDHDKRITGTVTVYRLFRVGQLSCRRFSHKLINSKKSYSAQGTSCRESDGSWKLIR